MSSVSSGLLPQPYNTVANSTAVSNNAVIFRKRDRSLENELIIRAITFPIKLILVKQAFLKFIPVVNFDILVLQTDV